MNILVAPLLVMLAVVQFQLKMKRPHTCSWMAYTTILTGVAVADASKPIHKLPLDHHVQPAIIKNETTSQLTVFCHVGFFFMLPSVQF
jgi:hypothetical protein